ncbi:MAG: hypothetical protein AB8F74_00750 [Saprospiraceae bacterium]
MKTWVTQFEAFCARTGELRTYAGPRIRMETWEAAQEWCFRNAGHLVVMGELVHEEEIPTELDKVYYLGPAPIVIR